jgi:hypothetical protein
MESHRIHLQLPMALHYGVAALLWLGLLFFLGALWRFDPEESSLYPSCYLLQSTGLKCGGCGVLRATHALLHGEWRLALQQHPLWVGALPLCLFCLFWHTVAVVRGKPWRVVEFFWAHPSILLVCGVAAFLFAFLRNVL